MAKHYFIIRLRVAELRRIKGWTLAKLAEESHVSKATLIRLEAQRTTRIDLDVIGKLAAAFDVAPGFLLTSEPQRTPPRPRRT